MHNILVLAAIALAAAFAVPKFYGAETDRSAISVATAKTAPPANAAAYYNAVTLHADARGHFLTAAIVDGRRMEFMVDTGASVLAIRESDARRLGIHPSVRDYTVRISTANGTTAGAPIELNRVEIGGISVRGVRAIIMPDQALGQNLLGMSFLSKVRWQQANGRLVLER